MDTHAVLGSYNHTITGEWARYETAYESSGNIPGVNFEMRLTNGSGIAQAVYAWGAQLTTNYFVSPYRTSGSANDSCYYTCASNTLYDNLSKIGTVSFWAMMPVASNLMLSATRYFLYAMRSDLSDLITIGLNSSKQIEFHIEELNSGSTLGTATDTETTMSANVWYHIAVTWDLVTNKRMRLYVNGNEKDSVTLTYSCFTDEPYRIYLGHGSNTMTLTLDDVLIRQDELTADEIKWIYDRERALGHQRTYFDALMLDDYNFNPVRRIGSERWDFELKAKEVIS
jgi:hypothetical protein